MSVEADRRRSELRESNDLDRCEIVEAKQKYNATKAVKNKLDDELKLELMTDVDRKRVTEVDEKQREKVTNKIDKSKENMIEEEVGTFLRKELIDAVL